MTIEKFEDLKKFFIRDAVHGDIYIEPKFLKLIDTPEFQRLRRIRQLSTAYLVFPCADHTRFSHSIGTYYIMKCLIEHFNPIISDINLDIKDRDKNLALATALLHDIGHGPFSHAFEEALPNSKNHEMWTIDIISSVKSNINKVLKEEFDENFPDDLVELIKKEKDIDKNEVKSEKGTEVDLFFILSSLISSQLDADRMDYLLRDSFFTGVSYGKFDVHRLIKGLTLTVKENKFCLCIEEKYLSTIEEYLMARYQMTLEVYYHNFKVEIEIIIQKIFKRACELYKKNSLSKDIIHPSIVAAYDNDENGMSIEDFISLDDNIILEMLCRWKEASDPILSQLCSAVIERKKFKKLYLLDNTEEDIGMFENELVEKLGKCGYNIEKLENEYFLLRSSLKETKAYNNEKNNIWVLRGDGSICDLSEVSKIINEKWKVQRNMAYINLELLKNLVDENLINEDEINGMIENYNSRNHIEIENKYIVSSEDTFERVLELFKEQEQEQGYQITESSPKKQKDIYYDTKDESLKKCDITLRTRLKVVNNQETYFLTIKYPVLQAGKTDLTSERFEYECKIDNPEIKNHKEYISNHLSNLVDYNELISLEENLCVENDRKSFILRNKKVEFEMVFDRVKYKNSRNSKTAQDYQIEIELKSKYLHRVNLKILCDYLEKEVPDLSSSRHSKYKRGLELTL